MSLFESIETSTGVPEEGAVSPAMRRAAMLQHPTLAVAAIEKGRIRETNASWKALFVLPPDVSVESHVATLFPNVTSADRFESALASELAEPGRATTRIEHLMMRRDGNAFLAEIVVCVFGAAPGDRALGGDAVWQVRDITVERTLRRELRDLEEYHRELSRHQWDMTFVIDRKGRIAYASSSIEGALGYRVNAVLGEPFTALLDPTHAGAAEQWLRAASRLQPKDEPAQTGDGFPLRVLHGDGSVRVLACRPRDCFAIPRIAGMVVHARDVTAVVQDDQVADLAAAEAASLRAALIELARLPSPTLDERIDAVLISVCGRLNVSVVTFWQSEDADGANRWRPRAVRCDADGAASKAEQDEFWPPLLSAANASSVSMPLIVEDITRSSSIAVETVPVLQAASVRALIEVPVLDEGMALGWLTVAAAEARAWPDAEVDFVIGSALLVALAIQGHARAPVIEDAPAVSQADRLTGLPRRGDAERHLAARIAAVGADGSLAALVVDLDHLQDVNDVLGLAAGDAAIKRMASVLVDVAGPHAYVARIDGDEFLLVVEGMDGRQVDALAQAILDRIGAPGDGEPNEQPVGASVGVARMSVDEGDATTLLLHADLAMREAKHRGRGQAFVFNPRLAASLKTRKELDAEIEEALARNEFTIFYQPQVGLASGEVVALEALLRWQHPTRGLLLPEAFIASAFKRGLIDAITKMVLTHVCEQLAAWRRQGTMPELPVAVNVSARQFHDRRLPAMVASALMKSGLPARLLVLEITEQSLIGDDVGIERVVKEMSRLGVRIAISDFNVGHASFKALRQLSVSQIKLDGAFVKGLPKDADSAIFVAACVDLGRQLKYQVVAEGVETREQFEHLRKIGCSVGQGFYLGAPLSAEEIHSYLESNRKNPIH